LTRVKLLTIRPVTIEKIKAFGEKNGFVIEINRVGEVEYMFTTTPDLTTAQKNKVEKILTTGDVTFS